MSTKQRQSKKLVPNVSGEEDDVGVLIYRESQLRKAEAAAAVESEKTSTASTHHRTSTRKRSPANNMDDKTPTDTQLKDSLKRKRESSLEEEYRPKKQAAKKRYRYECSADGCKNIVVKEGVCTKHGAKRKRCINEGCTNIAMSGRVCRKHGAKRKRKLCRTEGCTNIAVKEGVCTRHGAKRKRCSSEGCTNIAMRGGVCKKHGAKSKLCSSDGCTKYAQNGGVCTNMVLRSSTNDAAVKDALMQSSIEECPLSMGRRGI
eukprot:scaffold19806_cov74-Skeletonema_dohrnii-CCMP3373.AAC.3